MAADLISEKLTGKSLTGMIMEPIGQLIAQLGQKIGGVFTNLLRSLGVNEETARLVGLVLGTVVAFAVVVVGALVGKQAASKLMGPLVKSLGKQISSLAKQAGEKITEACKKLVANLIKEYPRLVEFAAKAAAKMGAAAAVVTQFIDHLFALLSKVLVQAANKLGIKTDASNMSINLMRASAGLEVGNTAAQTGLHIWKGTSEQASDYARANILELTLSKQQVGRLIDMVMVQWRSTQQWVTGLTDSVLDATYDDMAAGVFMAAKRA